jgi:uncharacterized protein
MNKAYEVIFDYVSDLEIIDTHEHLPQYESARDKDTDVLKEYTQQYFGSDLVSAGMQEGNMARVQDTGIPIMERWNLVECYWEAARNTGYGRCLDISARDLYGVKKICRETLEEVNHKFLKSLEPGHYQKVLKEKSKISIGLLDRCLDCDSMFFRSVFRMDSLIYPRGLVEVKGIEKEAGIRICCFDDWLEACEIILDKALRQGVVALKNGLAYSRPLHYERVSKNEAEVEFNELFKINHIPTWDRQVSVYGKKFQDYMMHFVLRLANKRNLTYQFHTGIQAGNGNRISSSDPSLLSNLFLDYPDVDFDIFHIGYPYQHIVSVLAKTFPNVYIDMCWAHIISPNACVHALVEWLDTVPANKISAFGGDSHSVDAVYGHQYIARVNVSKSLAQKVDEGDMDMDAAKHIASLLFYENPLRIFKLQDKI